jgi:glucose/arabinose dehydrogenase
MSHLRSRAFAPRVSRSVVLLGLAGAVVYGPALSACTSKSSGNASSASSSGGVDSGSDGSMTSSGSSGSSSGSSGSSSGTGSSSGVVDAWPDASMPGITNPCSLPGSIVYGASGTTTVPGGDSSWPSLSFLTLPAGFCAHYFGTVGNARQLRFSPSGDLFVASPTTGTTGGGPNGQAAIMVLPDDNLDGVADSNLTFMTGGASTQGILFAGGYFYYQNGSTSTAIERVPYALGARKASGTSEQVANITVYSSTLHWPKTMDVADDGTIYVGNGGDQYETCVTPHPFHGGILKIDPTGANKGGIQVAKGLRNPIAVRCAHGHDQCFALELVLDYSAGGGGREKILPIREGDDWGFPCCATKNLPYLGSPSGTDCSGVVPESNSFIVGSTPFGIDFETGRWPAPWGGMAYVVTHGAAGTWTGARLVAIPMNASTGQLEPSTDLDGGDVGMKDFGTGWDDNHQDHGRPAAVAFYGGDGRLFVADDNNGVIFWIAPAM